MINIKNMTNGKKLNLFDDWLELFKQHDGFELVEIFNMEQTSKKVVGLYANYDTNKAKNQNVEPVMVFRKVS